MTRSDFGDLPGSLEPMLKNKAAMAAIPMMVFVVIVGLVLCE